MNAARRVNSPMVMRNPPTSSITPAAISSGGSGWTGNGTGKPKNFDRLCSRNRSPTTILRIASSRGCQRESQMNSIFRPFLCRLLLALLRGVRRILGEQAARAVDHVDPIGERAGEDQEEILQRSVLEAPAVIEAVVGHMAEISFGLLH